MTADEAQRVLPADAQDAVRGPRGLLDRHWFGLLLVHAILIQSITFVLRPMTSYRAIQLGAPVFWLGALSACFAIVPLLVAIPSGRATDRVGERPVMLVGAAVVLVAAGSFFALRDSVLGLALANVVLGTGHLLSVVGEQSMLANRADRRRYDDVFGRYTFAAAVGQTAGPTLLVVIAGSGTYPDAVVVFGAAVAIAVALFLATTLIPAAAVDPRSAAQPSGASIRAVARLPGLMRALFASSVVLSAVDILVVYLPALGLQLGMSAALVGAILSLRSGASMLSRFFVGGLAAHLGRRRLLVTSIVLAAAAMLALVVAQPVVIVVVAVVVAGFALGVGQPLTMSWLAEASPPGLRGTAMSMRLAGNRLGQTVVPSSIGLVAAATGVGGVMAVTGAALLGAAMSVRGVAVDSVA
jgi:MFS family permease